ncbi:MAG: hypothetical protein GF307_05000 [candidate division Zixibacteria bacterium]|nr:hypothetical protein [candidate division Zixibacteria bacterium]
MLAKVSSFDLKALLLNIACFVFIVFGIYDVSPGLVIEGNITDPDAKAQIVDWADHVARFGGDVFKGYLPDTVTVLVASSNEEFNSYAGGRMPDWGIGVALPSRNMIVIKDPSRFSYGQNFGEVVRHEFAHLFLESSCRGCEWPRWFHEGCAVMFSGEWRVGRDITVARAAAFSELPKLRELESVNQFSQAKADLSYSMSFLALRYYMDEFGRQALVDLFDNMRAGQEFPTAFFHATGLWYGKWEDEFRDYLEKRYFFIFWFGDWPVLWTALVLFFVTIYIMKRIQNRRKIRRWEEEENYDRFDYGPPPD